jgi:hypothetical protein
MEGDLAKYVAIRSAPKAWVSATDVPEDRPTCTVFESDDTPQSTGLLDTHGTPLYRLVEKGPLGFQCGKR